MAGTVISSAAVNDDLSDIATALTGSLPRDGQAGMTGAFKAADGSTGASSITFSNELTTGFNRVGSGTIGVNVSGVQVGTFTSAGWTGPISAGTVPVGAIFDYGGSTAPTLFLLAFGQTVSRTTYAALFTAYGTTYGSGDGLTTFGLPDLRGRLSFGKDNMGGSTAGRLSTGNFGSSPIVLGNVGGVQSLALTATNIPTLSSSGSASVATSGGEFFPTTVGTNWGGPISVTGGGANSVPVLNSAIFNRNSLSGSASVTTSGTNATAFSLLNPGMIMNKIIYAGA